MLTSFDDYPLHQSSLPIAYSASTDPNHYDRYFFNGYSPDGSLYFGAAMGLYPNRHVVDAAFSVLRSEVQSSVFASGRAPEDRAAATTVGPITVDVVEPLHALRVNVNAPDQGIRAELLFTSRSAPIEEPHFFMRTGNRPVFDYTRLTQFGTWNGWAEIDGERIEVVDLHGSRDRSWGVRPVGEPAPTGAPTMAPQFFWLWAPVNFPSLSTHLDTNEFADGTRWHDVGAVVPVGGVATMMRDLRYTIEWRPGTRWAQAFTSTMVDPEGAEHVITLRPFKEFMMRGLGYGHPRYGHGTWHGESVVDGERLRVPVDTPCAREHVHVQALSHATYVAPDGHIEQGVGILEQLAIGPHPSGLRGLLDPF